MTNWLMPNMYSARQLALRTIFETWILLLRLFRRHSTIMAHAHLSCIGPQLIEDRLPSVIAKRNVLRQINLLTVLVASNLKTSDSQHMSTDEILCQNLTFLIADYETASFALTWCLYALAKLLESASQGSSNNSYQFTDLDDDGGKLEYLDCVREALRLRAPVTWTMRVATKDDQISVAKPTLDQSGESRDSIKIRKHYHHIYSGQQQGHMGGGHLLLQV